MSVSKVIRHKARRTEMKITRVAIDLGKSAFHVHAVDRCGTVVEERRLTRRVSSRFMGELEPCLVGLEACGGAHYRARAFRAMGRDARLTSAQLVKAYVKSSRNDLLDAEAIREAVSRPNERYRAAGGGPGRRHARCLCRRHQGEGLRPPSVMHGRGRHLERRRRIRGSSGICFGPR